MTKWRRDSGLSLDEAGALLGRSREWVRRVELGYVVPVKKENIDKVEAITGISASAWVKP